MARQGEWRYSPPTGYDALTGDELNFPAGRLAKKLETPLSDDGVRLPDGQSSSNIEQQGGPIASASSWGCLADAEPNRNSKRSGDARVRLNSKVCRASSASSPELIPEGRRDDIRRPGRQLPLPTADTVFSVDRNASESALQSHGQLWSTCTIVLPPPSQYPTADAPSPL